MTGDASICIRGQEAADTGPIKPAKHLHKNPPVLTQVVFLKLLGERSLLQSLRCGLFSYSGFCRGP